MLTTQGSTNPILDTVKIKEEKLTPPASPKVNSTSAGLSITDNLLDNILSECKPITEPIKSSDEILADLFKVFNATPPTLDDDGSTKDSSSHKKKKHKKEKKVKKHKKHSRNNSECKSSDDDDNASQKSKKHKVKKSKKRKATDDNDIHDKKRHKKSKQTAIKKEKSDGIGLDVVAVKKDKIDDKNARTKNDSKSPSEIKLKSHDSTATDAKTTKSSDGEKKQSLSIQVCVTKDNDGLGSKRKIVIKNLVDSTVYHDTLKEVDAKQKEKLKEKEHEKNEGKERERAKNTRDRDKRKHTSSRRSKSNEKEHRRSARSRSSSLSLSDEETYLRERERDVRTKVSCLSSHFYTIFTN